MKRKASSQFEPNVSPAVSQDLIDPQLRQSPTERPTTSSIRGEHTTPAADGHNIGNPTSSSKHEESEIDDEDVATGQDSAEDGQTAPQVQTMAGVGRLATMHGDLGVIHAGFNSYMQARRTVAIDNDDYPVLAAHNTAYVRMVYDAIITYPTDMTTDQTRMVTFYGKKLNVLGDDADQYMADIASMVVAGVYSLHTHGDHLFDAQFKSLKPHKDDSTMTATERVNFICYMLQNYKKHVVDLMAGGFDAITKFVAAPKGTAKRKEDYKSNNDHRSTNLTKLRAAAKIAKKKVEDEDEDEDDE